MKLKFITIEIVLEKSNACYNWSAFIYFENQTRADVIFTSFE